METMTRWQSLPESAKARILDEHRTWSVDDTAWWDCVYEGFKEDMRNVGIDVETMYFSGFWSQGDGACFEGAVEDWPLFLKSVGYNDPLLADHLSANAVFSCGHRGRYYHENCTSFNASFELPDNDEDDYWLESFGRGEALRDAVLLATLNQYNHNTLEAEFTEAFKDHMRDLYRRLEQEHEYLTSDEAVLEALDANDMLDELIEEALEHEND